MVTVGFTPAQFRQLSLVAGRGNVTVAEFVHAMAVLHATRFRRTGGPRVHVGDYGKAVA